jgi:hypothetical protein
MSSAAVTLAVLVTMPVADGLMTAVIVYVTLAPGARVAIVSVSAPDTLVCPFPLQVKEVTPAGTASLTATPVAVLGPVFVTTTVYVVVVPGTAVVVPSVLVTPTSTCGVSVSVSEAELLPGLVSFAAVMVDVLVTDPVAAGSIVATTV